MPVIDLADEKLETLDVVGPNRSALGHAITQHADTRYCDRLPWYVSTGGHKYFRRSPHNAAVRNLRRAIYRCRAALQRAEPSEITGSVFSRKLFSADFSQICR